MTQALLRAAALLIPKGAPPGQAVFTNVGPYSQSWVCPAGVTSVSLLCIGGWSDPTYPLAGGALEYANNIAVTPGTTYYVYVASSTGASNYTSLVSGLSACYAGSGTNRGGGDGGGDGGASGGNGYESCYGGAGGYAGAGGKGATGLNNASNGAGGGGGGSALVDNGDTTYQYNGAGGVGLLGQGSNGAGGTFDSGGTYDGRATGKGGSSGTDGTNAGYTGGNYGGGIRAGGSGNGAVRIIWPGTTRQFPSTNTTDM